MKLPMLQGTCTQTDFFIYAAADETYFDQHGRALINSVLHNTSHGVHIHIYNPRQDQIEWCQQRDRVTVTWEHVNADQFNSAVDIWSQPNLSDQQQARKNKMLGLKVVDPRRNYEENLRSWLQRTYYACVRFVRLAEIIKPGSKFLAIDVDGIVRQSFPHNLGTCDFYLYQKEKHGKFAGYLAGAILYNARPQTEKFIKQIANTLQQEIENDNIYWFLDQNTLDAVVPNYDRGLLPLDYIDWHMGKHSAIWSAKGRRKELAVFKQEQQKYQ